MSKILDAMHSAAHLNVVVCFRLKTYEILDFMISGEEVGER